MTSKPTLYLIDGSGYIFRAYHALPALTDPHGTPVGAVIGFLNMMLKLMEKRGSAGDGRDAVAVVFDSSRKTFRNRSYPDYKANRPAAPEDLVPQFALVREATDALGIARVEMEDYEADDLIATYARLGCEQGWEVVIVSSDKDLMQLVGEDVRLHDPIKDKPIREAEVQEKFAVPPSKLRELLALTGDSSDNIPGVPGIGPKTAAELIAQFGSLEQLLARTAEIRQPKRRETLEANLDKARLSFELVGLKDDVPVTAPLSEFVCCPPDSNRLQGFLQKHGFRTLLARLKDRFGFEEGNEPKAVVSSDAPRVPIVKYELAQDEVTLVRWIARAREQGYVALDAEGDLPDPLRAELVGLAIATAPGQGVYMPVGHTGMEENAASVPAQMDLLNPAAGREKRLAPGQLVLGKVLALVKPLLEDKAVLKIGHNLKYAILLFRRYGIEINPVDDTMLLSYALGAGLHGHGMEEVAERYLQQKPTSYDEVVGAGKARLNFAEIAIEKARDYAVEEADFAFRLQLLLKAAVQTEGLLTLYETIERPLIPVLAAMEAKGIKVDAAVLASLSREFGARMHVLEAEIHRLAGHEFNVGSPKQLGEVLFEELGFPGGKKSAKTGAYGTDNQMLEELVEQGHALPARVIEWRQLSKLRSTYTDALPQQINPATGRVHTHFAMAATTTGRLSSMDPNLQNIPIRTAEGKTIRRAFVAEQGHKLISADYSQIELRLLAHIANIEPLKQAFTSGSDIHAITASQMFGLPVDAVDAEHRRRAKTINFGIIYGISAHGLAVRLGISRGEAAAYIEQYFRQYPGIRDYMESAKEEARKHGYVTTLFGRRCHVPGILEKNPARRQFYERAAINAPLQGTAADIIKRAMLRVHEQLHRDGLKTTMLLQVHDELVFEAPEAEVDAVLPVVRTAMEKAMTLSVPLTVEIGVGDNWGEIH